MSVIIEHMSQHSPSARKLTHAPRARTHMYTDRERGRERERKRKKERERERKKRERNKEKAKEKAKEKEKEREREREAKVRRARANMRVQHVQGQQVKTDAQQAMIDELAAALSAQQVDATQPAEELP